MLVREVDSAFALTPVGETALDGLVDGDWRPLVLAVVGSGAYEGELARLVELGTQDGDVLLVPEEGRSVAPQVYAFLAWVPTLRRSSGLAIPAAELSAVLSSSAMEAAAKTPDWVEDMQNVGWRAELYTVRFERGRLGPGNVLHVARDVGDGLGYDVEATEGSSERLIEVKGSRGRPVRFVITAREREVATDRAGAYEIQFWGGISLDRAPRDEYESLIGEGYPIVIRDVAEALASDDWRVEPQAWRVSQSASSDRPV